jgi:hypothetical protein
VSRYIVSLSTVLLYFLIEYYFVCFRRYVQLIGQLHFLKQNDLIRGHSLTTLTIIDYLPKLALAKEFFLLLNVIKKIFSSVTFPVLPLLVNVVKERSLAES